MNSLMDDCCNWNLNYSLNCVGASASRNVTDALVSLDLSRTGVIVRYACVDMGIGVCR